jgi:hypothetical protein
VDDRFDSTSPIRFETHMYADHRESERTGGLTMAMRRLILRANALYLGIAAAVSLAFMDFPGIYFGTGPEGRVLNGAWGAGVGFVEAHGLALIISVLLWRAVPARSWHVTGASVGALLGTCNLVFWQVFIDTDALAMGYITTSLHWTFAFAQFFAAIGAGDHQRIGRPFAHQRGELDASGKSS